MTFTEADDLNVFGRLPDVALPIALLPLRIETRFMIDDANAELWVRIYPDEIHVDTHEPELTEDEASWGRHFWAQTWRTGRGDDAEAVARRHRIWEQLAQRYDPERATWIVEAVAPTNPEDRPDAPLADDAPLAAPPIHAVPAIHTESWTRAPVARLLPERFVVLGYRGGARVTVRMGVAVPSDLHVGPDPSAPPPAAMPDDELAVDEGIRWLVDFKVAEEIGMAIRVPLTVDDMELGFDTLVVTGLRTTPEPAAEAAAVEDLVAAHRYTEGIAVTPVGTPTNNSDTGPSGHSARVLDPVSTYPRAVEAGPDTAAARLAAALGVRVAALAALGGAGSRQDAEAVAMLTLLWPATGGYFLEHLFAVLPQAPSAPAHALANVRPEGPLPLLRVGRQPYGVLPVTSLDRWPVLPPASGPLGFPRPRVELMGLKGLRDRWRTVTARVPRIDRRPGGQAPTEPTIMAVMRGAPSSAAYDMRLVFDDALFGVPGLHRVIQLPPQAAQRAAGTQGILRSLGVLGDARLLQTVLATTSADLRRDALVAPADAPHADAELLAWLRDSPAEVIAAEQGLATPPEHLLYLIARHAVLLTYASVATQIQQAGGDTAPAADPPIVDVTETATVTVGRRIARPLPGVTKPLHELTAADHPAAAALDGMRAALDELAGLAPDRLATLLAGTLDVFAYRLDAWITSLATRRLSELRAARPDGVVVGAFGWLEHVRPRAPLAPVASPPPNEAGPLVVDPLSAGFVHAPSLPHAATAAVLRAGYVASGATASDQSAANPFAVDLTSRRVRVAEWLLDGVRQGQELGALLGQRFERGLHDHGLDRYIAAFRRVAPFGELAAAQADAADAAAELARLQAGNPDLAAATAALAAAQAGHAAVIREQGELPARVARAEEALVDLDRQRTDVQRRIQQLHNLIQRAGENPRLEEQLTAATERRVELDAQVASRRAAIDAARARQSVIGGAVAAAGQAVVDAQQRVAAASAPLPGVDAAIERDAAARAELERVLAEHRRRRLYPPTATIEALEAVEAAHVVDGLALTRLHRRGGVPFGTKGLPAPGTTDHGSVVVELTDLDAALDAVADALTAESVHQLVQGNPQRAGASLDAVAKRTVPPPELEFARTPRTGVAVTHRVLAVAPASGAGWPTDARQARALAEPSLERWAETVLGDPAQIRGDVRYVDAAGELVGSHDLRMAAAGLGALDVLALVDGAGAPRPELTGHLVELARATRPADVPDDARVELVLDRDPDWPRSLRSFAEVFEVARAVNELLGTSRPIAARDLAVAGDVGASVDVAELAARADALEQRVASAHAALVAALADSDAGALRAALTATLHLGVPGGVPAASVAGDDALGDLSSRARGAATDLDGRLRGSRAVAADPPPAGAPDDERGDHQVARIRALLGEAFVVLPRLLPVAGAELGAALADGPGRFGGDRAAPSAWLHRVADVRRGIEHLQTVMLYAAGGPGSLGVAQLPFTAGERWTALPAAPGGEVPGGRTSIVVHASGPLSITGGIAGLFVDEWVEVVPNATEITGVACNIDEPAAQPPQAVLLAVAPPQSPRWGLDLLESILLETLDLARLRAVSPEQLAASSDVEQVLPALYFGLNLSGDTVSTDFTRAMEA